MQPVDLNSRAFGEGNTGAVPLVLAHGLLGSSRNWQALGKAWGRERPVHAVDLRDHGYSPWTGEITHASMAADLQRLIEGLPGGKAHVLGHSMGGKAAMALALAHPEAVAKLVVVDVAPVTYRHGFEGYINAMLSLDLASMERRGEADQALAGKVPDPAIRAFLLHNLDAEQDGKLAFRPNLRGLLDCMPAITGWPDEPNGQTFEGEALFVRGSASDYVLPEHEPLIRSLFPNTRIETIEGAGHWVHAQAPKELSALLKGFLEEG